MSNDDIRIGETVLYAGGLYRVADRCCDLLTLDGVAGNIAMAAIDGDGSGSARERVTVLASDVRRVAAGE